MEHVLQLLALAASIGLLAGCLLALMVGVCAGLLGVGMTRRKRWVNTSFRGATIGVVRPTTPATTTKAPTTTVAPTTAAALTTTTTTTTEIPTTAVATTTTTTTEAPTTATEPVTAHEVWLVLRAVSIRLKAEAAAKKAAKAARRAPKVKALANGRDKSVRAPRWAERNNWGTRPQARRGSACRARRDRHYAGMFELSAAPEFREETESVEQLRAWLWAKQMSRLHQYLALSRAFVRMVEDDKVCAADYILAAKLVKRAFDALHSARAM